jgi:DNA-binding HxlR family transcriptional regulator
MLGKTYPNQECSAARSLELVGERWTLLILRDAIFRGYVRYAQFSESLGVATNILARRLDGLVDAGLMEARKSGRREYHLTDKGRALKPVIVALTEWGDTWLERPGPVVFCDGIDGELVELGFRTASSQKPVESVRVVAQRRPGV